MPLIILSLLFLVGCSPVQVPIYEPPRPVHIEPDSLRPIFTLADKVNYKEKSQAIVQSYAQCEARVYYLEKLKNG